MHTTHMLLDGIQDPAMSVALSDAWRQAGFDHTLDLAAQHASFKQSTEPLAEDQAGHAAQIARRFGVEPRDRVGQTFHPDTPLPDLRDRVIYEYRCRLATALVFGLPALGLYYLAPILASGATNPRSLFYPWLFQALLVGWMALAAAWPVLWNAGLAIRCRCATGDMLTSLIILAAFIPSALGTVCMVLGRGTWLSTAANNGPAFHAVAYVTILATAQRWLLHRYAARLSDYSQLTLRGFAKLIAFWMLVAAIITPIGGWHLAIAFAMLLPPNASTGGINPWTPGWLSVLPVFGFAGLFLLAPRAMAAPIDGVQIEIAAGFSAIMTAAYAYGWSHIPTRNNP